QTPSRRSIPATTETLSRLGAAEDDVFPCRQEARAASRRLRSRHRRVARSLRLDTESRAAQPVGAVLGAVDGHARGALPAGEEHGELARLAGHGELRVASAAGHRLVAGADDGDPRREPAQPEPGGRAELAV